MRPRPVYPLDGFLVIRVLGSVDVQELSGIPVDERKPRTLNLYHDPVTFFESMVFVGNDEFDFRNLSRLHRLGIFQTLAKLAPHDLASNEHLEMPHPNSPGIRDRIGRIGWKDINDFHDPVAIGARSRGEEVGSDLACK